MTRLRVPSRPAPLLLACLVGIVVALSAPALAAAAGDVTPTPAQFNFGNQDIHLGQTNSQAVNLQNLSGETLNVSNGSSYAVEATTATISGPGAAFFSIGYNGCQFTLSPGTSCSLGVNFSPTEGGTKTAQLELSNDGTDNPLVIPLSATALAGPKAVISPGAHDFGDIGVGSASASTTLRLSNAGDFPLQVQQLLVLSGAPQLFPLMSDTCSQQILEPGASCEIVVRFKPAAAGARDATIFAITNQNGPVVTSTLTGTGVPAPHGAASITGTVAAGNSLTCAPSGYPESTDFAYQWLRDGRAVPGATGARFTLRDSDVGTRFACRLTATNSVGSETVTSPQTAPIAAQLLSDLEGSLVGPSVCRVVQAPSSLRLGGRTVKVVYGSPTTPSASLLLRATGLKMKAMIDGTPVASGKGQLSVTPRALEEFEDGSHALQVSSSSAQASVQVALAPCNLAASLEGGPKRPTVVTVSGRAGLDEPVVRLPRSLRIQVARATLGTISIEVGGQPSQTFSLFGARTSSNGITVLLKAHAIKIENLPSEAGVVSVELDAGVVSGRGGLVTATGELRGATGTARAAARTLWRR
jgi:opacity protein-like surface antigen